MAGYAAVIDLRVNGLDGLRTVEDTVASISRLIKQIKPVPALFDRRAGSEITAAKKQLDDLVKAYADGGNRSAAFSTTVAGLNQQLGMFRTVAANAKTSSDQFTNALKAAEIATNKLNGAELKRLDTLKDIYTRQAVGGLSAEDQGPSGLTKSVLALGRELPSSIAGLRAYSSELDRVFNIVEAGSVDYRALSVEIARVNAAMDVATGAGPVQGPALPPGMRSGAGTRGLTSPIGGGAGFPGSPGARTAMFENLALGAGFPLLFGGGAGQVTGGLLGSFVGTGFGGQILGSAIGQQLEDAQRRITEIGNATKQLNMDSLRDSAITVTAELTNQVRLLQEAGQAEAARAAIADQVTLQTGLVPEAVQNITNNVNLLGNTWNEFLGAVSGTLSIIGAPFVTALTVILQGAAKILQLVNLIASGLATGIAKGVEKFISLLPGGARLLELIKEKTAALVESDEQRVAALQALTDKQHIELQNLQRITDLEKNRQLGRTQIEKEINASIDNQLAQEKIRQEYAEKAKQIRQEYGNITSAAGQRELDLALAQNAALENQSLKQQAIKNSLTEQGLAIEANTQKYNEAATAVQQQIAALDRGNQVAQSRFSAEGALNDLYGAQLQRQYELATTAEERFNIAIRMFEQQVKAAQIEYQQAIANNQLLVQKAALEANLVKIKYQQLEAEKQIALAGAQSRGADPAVISQVNAGYDKALALQKGAVEEAYKQVQATQEIANNQNVVAEAVMKTKLIQAESSLAQKLSSEEIGMSKEQANALAGNMARVVAETLNGTQNAQQLVGVIEVGAQKTYIFASAMSDVAAAAHNAAINISNAYRAQQQLNAATSGGAPSPTPPQKAAAGAFWPGGFKAFAKGGMVNRPTLGLIGEGGEPEYVIPESKAKNFAMNYLMGARGSSAIPKFAEGGYAGPGSASVSIQTGPVMQMNGTNYVTTAQMQQAVQAGVDRTLALIAGDQSMRRSVGIY